MMSRVAVLVNFIPPYRVPLFEALQSRLADMRVFVSTPVESNRPWPAHWGNLDVVVQRNLVIKTARNEPAARQEARYLHVPYDTLHHLRRFRPDVIISAEFGVRTILAAVYKRMNPSVRLVMWATVSERTERNRGAVARILRPLLVRNADRVLVNGRSGAAYVRALGVSDERIVLAPYTTDLQAFRAVGRPGSGGASALRLLFVGMLVERKGLVPFLRALSRWAAERPATPINFDIAGDGPERAAVERFACPANLTVRVLGNIGYDQLSGIYATADVLVFPTFADEWGVVVNEALASGLPVLGSCHSQAVDELVVDGQTGWRFDPETPSTIDAALTALFATTPGERQRMGDAGRRVALELSPARVAERIANALICEGRLSS